MSGEKSCIVCGNKKDFNLRWKRKKHHPSYYACNSCGLVFAYPQEHIDFKQNLIKPVSIDEYDARVRNYDLRFSKIIKYLPNDKPKVLDIGCQNSIFLNFMKSKGSETMGIEPSEEYAKFCHKNFRINVINGLFEDYKIKQLFDLITMYNILEHTKAPRETLSKAYNLLEKGGILVLELPNIFTLQSTLSFGFWHHFENHHNWFFNKFGITRILEETGFKVNLICFIPKIVCLSKILDGLLTKTIYMHIKRDSYLRFRKTLFYRTLNKAEIKVNIRDYLFVIAKKG